MINFSDCFLTKTLANLSAYKYVLKKVPLITWFLFFVTIIGQPLGYYIDLSSVPDQSKYRQNDYNSSDQIILPPGGPKVIDPISTTLILTWSYLL